MLPLMQRSARKVGRQRSWNAAQRCLLLVKGGGHGTMIRDPEKIQKKASKIARRSGKRRERGLWGKEPWRTINFEASRRGNEPGRASARICMQEQLATPPRGSPPR